MDFNYEIKTERIYQTRSRKFRVLRGSKISERGRRVRSEYHAEAEGVRERPARRSAAPCQPARRASRSRSARMSRGSSPSAAWRMRSRSAQSSRSAFESVCSDSRSNRMALRFMRWCSCRFLMRRALMRTIFGGGRRRRHLRENRKHYKPVQQRHCMIV